MISINKLCSEEVLRLLIVAEKDFYPPSSLEIDLKRWAEKLSQHGYFVLTKENNKTLGLIAYYKNDEERFIYIPLFWVNSDYQRQGIGGQMLDALIKKYSGNYNDIRLEVTKTNSAYCFYLKKGFKKKEDRGKKFLMSLEL